MCNPWKTDMQNQEQIRLDTQDQTITYMKQTRNRDLKNNGIPLNIGKSFGPFYMAAIMTRIIVRIGILSYKNINKHDLHFHPK